MAKSRVTVIISTYNQPEWLQKVLWGYECQTVQDFEIIIADDGSMTEVQNRIFELLKNSSLTSQYVWQEDEGFQKNKILNKALVKASSEYIIFTDGDCVPREDFVQKHLKMRRKGHALSGGYFKLAESISEVISKDDIVSQRCFNKDWLLKKGLQKTFKVNKLTASGVKEKFLNRFTTTKATFDGMNVSAWKQDLLDVNGFDERMNYGGEDREIGERMMNNGIKFIQSRYSLICLHLYHERPYVPSKNLDINNVIRKITKKDNRIVTEFGIKKANE